MSKLRELIDEIELSVNKLQTSPNAEEKYGGTNVINDLKDFARLIILLSDSYKDAEALIVQREVNKRIR